MNPDLDLHNSRIQNICMTVGLFVASERVTSRDVCPTGRRTHNNKIKSLNNTNIAAKECSCCYMMEGNWECTHQGNNFLIYCLYKQCLKLVLRGYFPTNCWLGTKSAGILSHLNQDQQCFPRKHGRQPTQKGTVAVRTCSNMQTQAIRCSQRGFGFRGRRNSQD